MAKFSYLITIIVFAGSALAIELRLATEKLRPYRKAIWILLVISVLFAFTEGVALSWQAWEYNPLRTLNIYFVTEIETYLFAITTTLAVAFATFIVADYEAAGKPILKTIATELKKRWGKAKTNQL